MERTGLQVVGEPLPSQLPSDWITYPREVSEVTTGLTLGALLGIPGALAVLASLLVWGSIPGAMFGGFFTLVGLGIFFSASQLYLRESDLEEARLWMPEGQARMGLGEDLPVCIELAVRVRLPVRGVRLRFFLEEKAVYRNGSDSKTFRREEYLQSYDLPWSEPLEPGQGYRLRHRFRVPEDGPATFEGPNNQLTWWLELHLEVPGRRDQQVAWRIQVRPVHRSQASMLTSGP